MRAFSMNDHGSRRFSGFIEGYSEFLCSKAAGKVNAAHFVEGIGARRLGADGRVPTI